MKIIVTPIFVSLLFLADRLNGQQVNDIIKKGNDLYRQQQYEPAKSAYSDALNKDSSNNTARFNLANTTYRLSKSEDAIKSFDQLSERYNSAPDKDRVYYNKGVVLTNQKRLEESIEAYKDALRQNPNDQEARENLQKALIELKKRTPPPPKKQNQNKKKDQKQQQQPKMDRKEAEQKLKLLEQKEKQLQERMQQQKSKTSGNNTKDW